MNYVDINQKTRGGQGGLFSKICNIYPPPIFLFFESYQHNVPQKNKFFNIKLIVEKIYTWSFLKILKNWVFVLHLFHIGALCSKTLDGLGRVKKSMKKFKSHFSVLLLTQTMRKSCPQSEIFSLRGKYIFGPA